ncbi:hypothetical protein GF068_17905 [Polyangium spumosum]|uniref:Uncharacterized protein n=2 Tax=Polyangium spumosum TaxID=889282 RepID=A0A6N7PNM7_9BACT|nr:hypothetical protein [Polyangium spumosum]
MPGIMFIMGGIPPMGIPVMGDPIMDEGIIDIGMFMAGIALVTARSPFLPSFQGSYPPDGGGAIREIPSFLQCARNERKNLSGRPGRA